MTSMNCLSRHLKNTMLLKSVTVRCRNSNLLNLDVVSEAANNKAFKCLFGFYQDEVPGADYSKEFAAEHFGFNEREFGFVFGSSSASTVGERIMMIDAHIEHLQKMTRPAEQPDAA